MSASRGAGAAAGSGRPSGLGPAPGSSHPGFIPYAGLREELLRLPAPDWPARCSVLASRRDLRSATGAPLRFVPGGEATGAIGYEAAIHDEGRIACRTEGRGGLHDLHNALVWLTFPQVKATLNRLHLDRPAPPPGPMRNRGRGRLRDAVTLLDESGMLWLSGLPRLDAQLAARDWRGLLVGAREQVRERVLPIIIGHGLLEKLATPYKALTAHCLILEAPWLTGERTASKPVDAEVAPRLAAAFAAGTPPVLTPLPILGLPGWDPANVDPSYYDDARVFRAARAPRA